MYKSLNNKVALVTGAGTASEELSPNVWPMKVLTY